MSEVKRIKTPLDERDLGDVLIAGHRAAFGSEPSPSRIAVAWAQNALEAARGKAIWNHCLGNITAGPDWPGDFWTIDTEEQFTPGVWKTIHMHFRAHDSAEAGAVDWWKRMAQRYAAALPYFDRGDAAGAAVCLHGLRYFTADATVYARGMASLAAEWVARGS